MRPSIMSNSEREQEKKVAQVLNPQAAALGGEWPPGEISPKTHLPMEVLNKTH